LKGIHLIKPTKFKTLKLPKITSAEKEVLLLILKGATMNFIGSRLNIATKTAYTHQRSAFKKMGIRKCQDMLKLPDNYINYLCGVR
jgi:DNA-binding CsgD family transcriptional regulator